MTRSKNSRQGYHKWHVTSHWERRGWFIDWFNRPSRQHRKQLEKHYHKKVILLEIEFTY